ncbi:unnamed protein product [Ixodes hexagonus]
MSTLFSETLASNGPLVHRLIQALNRNDVWKSLRSVIPGSCLSSTYAPTSADDLVLALQNSFVLTSELIRWLELVDAFDALLLLKPSEPVTIALHPEPYLRLEAGHESVLRLTCRASSFPPPKYEWYFNDKPLSSRTEAGPALEISNLTTDHSGTYKCRAWNACGSESFTNSCEVVVSPCQRKLFNKPPARYATDKVALLISNANYQQDEKLRLTENDVESLAKSLAALNFRILAFKDLNKRDIDNAVSTFRHFLQSGTYSVFYYAGHGFKWCGKDYIQAIDCSSDCSVEDCVCFQEVVARIRSTPSSFNLILWDACRDCRETSLDTTASVVQTDPPQGNLRARRSSILVYATSPYNSAVEVKGHQNGLFMEHLKRHIGQAVPVHEAIRHTLRDFESHALSDWQIPVVKYDIAGDHSLCDAILDGPGYRSNESLWDFVSTLPPDEEFRVTETGLRLRVTFSCYREVFCNCMIVTASLLPPVPDIHIDLQTVVCDGARVVNQSSAVLEVSSLQTLVSPLQLSVVLRDLNSKKVVYLRNLHCGHPLIAAWKLRNSS